MSSSERSSYRPRLTPESTTLSFGASLSDALRRSNAPSPDAGPTDPGWTAEIAERPKALDPVLGKPFKECILAIAVDVSYSTTGVVLEAEKQAIHALCNQLSDDAKSQTKILPWCNTSKSDISPSSLCQLSSGGSTNPCVLLSNERPLYLLKNASLACLFTDGKIKEKVVVKFAEQIAKQGLHGTTWAVIVFGDGELSPADSDISVGVSLFAMAPNCVYLYYNVHLNTLRILQSKGSLNSLLLGQPPPTLDEATTWEDLPLVRWNHFRDLLVLPSKVLSPDEINLPSGRTVNLDALLNDEIQDPDIIADIMDNPENLQSVALTVPTRNVTPQFHDWLTTREKGASKKRKQASADARVVSEKIPKSASSMASPSHERH